MHVRKVSGVIDMLITEHASGVADSTTCAMYNRYVLAPQLLLVTSAGINPPMVGRIWALKTVQLRVL
jgi:hypothetical protein